MAHPPKSSNWPAIRERREREVGSNLRGKTEKYNLLKEAKREKIKEVVENEDLDIEDLLKK